MVRPSRFGPRDNAIPPLLLAVVGRIDTQSQFDTSKNTSKTDGCRKFLRVLSARRGNFSEKSGIEPAA
jgi:hypothetical protein